MRKNCISISYNYLFTITSSTVYIIYIEQDAIYSPSCAHAFRISHESGGAQQLLYRSSSRPTCDRHAAAAAAVVEPALRDFPSPLWQLLQLHSASDRAQSRHADRSHRRRRCSSRAAAAAAAAACVNVATAGVTCCPVGCAHGCANAAIVSAVGGWCCAVRIATAAASPIDCAGATIGFESDDDCVGDCDDDERTNVGRTTIQQRASDTIGVPMNSTLRRPVAPVSALCATCHRGRHTDRHRLRHRRSAIFSMRLRYFGCHRRRHRRCPGCRPDRSPDCCS